jgi:putative phosphoribosyl transferase
LNRFLFHDRVDAGRKLGASLSSMKGKDVVVLGIPRGGVVVANEVSKALGAPLDIIVTRKIEAPGEPEYALGAVTQEGDVIIDRQAAEALGATKEYIDSQITKKRSEVSERTKKFRGDVPFPQLEGKVVLVVDDGIATGSSVGAAVMSVKKRGPKEVVVAVPVAPAGATETLEQDGNRVVCLQTPASFLAIGEFYENFDQVGDDEVKRIIDESRARRA